MERNYKKVIDGVEVDMTDDEIADFKNKELQRISEYELEVAIRNRNARLLETDWTQLPDVPEATRNSYLEYRQALRDVPSQPGFPNDIIWPEKPE